MEEQGAGEQALSLADIINTPNALDVLLDPSAFTELMYRGEQLYTMKGISKILSRNRDIIPGPDVTPRQFIDYLKSGTLTDKKNNALTALKDLFFDNDAVLDYLEGNEQRNNGARPSKEPKYAWIDSWIDKPVSVKKLKWISAALKQGGEVASYVRAQLNENERANQPELNRLRNFSEIKTLGIAYDTFLEIVVRHHRVMHQTGYSHAQVIGLFLRGERLLESAVDKILETDPSAQRYMDGRMFGMPSQANYASTNQRRSV